MHKQEEKKKKEEDKSNGISMLWMKSKIVRMKRNTLISILISFFKTGILLRNEKIWVFTTKRLIDGCKKFLFVISLISELTSFVVIVENEKSF